VEPHLDAGVRTPACDVDQVMGPATTRAFCARDLSQVDYVYVWAGGIHVNVRLDEVQLCLFVMDGALGFWAALREVPQRSPRTAPNRRSLW
jgi:hypothetical protein